MSGNEPTDRVIAALEAILERVFDRCLFPAETKEAFAALDAYRLYREGAENDDV